MQAASLSNIIRGRRYLLVILLLSLEGGLGNTVQVTLAGLCDAAATLVLINLNYANLLERLEDLAVDGAGGVNVVGGAGAAVLGGTDLISIHFSAGLGARGFAARGGRGGVPVDLAETANTDGLAHVDVAGDGGGADVEPVDVLGRQLVGVCATLAYARALRICMKNLRDVLTVSTQPVDKTVSKLIVQLSPSDGIQVLSFTRWNSTNLGFS